MRKKISLFSTVILLALVIYLLPRYTKYHLPVSFKPKPKQVALENKRIQKIAKTLLQFCNKNHYNTKYGFIADMQQHSGLKRFYVYDFIKDSIVNKGLVAHGSCNSYYLENAKFDNTVGCGCSSIGKYKVSFAYNGRFGKAYKLIGLDSTNNNALERNVVLHGYSCVPDDATYPQPICNSLGCAMVSYRFLDTLTNYIAKENNNIILWIIK